MPKLPTRESLGGLPSTRPSGKIVQLNVGGSPGAEIARGISDLGKGIGIAGAIIGEHQERDEAYETERRFHEFQWNQQKTLDEQARSIQPGQAGDFPERFTQTYSESAKEFFKSVPERLKRQYDDKLLQTERSLYGNATVFARTEQARYSVNSLGDMRENVFQPKARVTPTAEIDSVAGDHDRLVDQNPYLTPIQKDELKRKGRREIGMSHLDEMKPRDFAALSAARTGQVTANPEGLLRKFEGFKETAYWDVNAWRTGYGSDTVTRADGTIERVTKDTRVTKEDAERDLVRRTAEFGQVAEKQVGQERWATLAPNVRAALVSVTYNYGSLPGTVVQAVQGGDPAAIASAVRSLPANPKRREQEAGVILGKAAMPESLTSLTEEDWQKVSVRQENKRLRMGAEIAETYERNILDAPLGKSELIPRSKIEQDADLSDAQRNTLLRQHDQATKGNETLRLAVDWHQTPNDPKLNPFEKASRDQADVLYQYLGGDAAALEAVTAKAGIVPNAAMKQMRAGIVSGDAAKATQSLQLASNLLAKNPNIFAGAEGEKDLEENAVKFKHLVDYRGFDAKKAAQKIIDDEAPEHKAKVAARIKNEDIPKLIREKLKVNDIQVEFRDTWFKNPAVGFDEDAKQAMFTDYADAFKDAYLSGPSSGDVDMAKANALRSLHKVWGITRVTGAPIVTRYPPEKAPYLQVGIENLSDRIAAQAMADIKDVTGQAVPRDKIFLMPTLKGETATKYKAGEPVPYMLGYYDKNGMPHFLNPGKGFEASLKLMQEADTAANKVKFDMAQAERTRTGMVPGPLDALDRVASNVRGGIAKIPNSAEAEDARRTAAKARLGKPRQYDLAME